MARTAAASKTLEPRVDDFAPFLTAFDPSDLPGSSVDPLGFDRGYNLLADKILPGITNVGQRPRYFSLLCAGIAIADDRRSGLPDRQQYEHRLQTLLRLERLWVLANLRASGDESLASEVGIRGARYGKRQLERLERRGATRTDTRFELLVRQVPYGVVGIYGNVANGMRMLERKTLTLTQDLGRKLGDAFLHETQIPRSILDATADDAKEVSLSSLQEWGARAHLSAKPGPIEATCLDEALHTEGTRSRMAGLLAKHPGDEGEREQTRLERIARSIQGETDRDLAEAIVAILAFEECFRWATFTLERLLWLAKAAQDHAVRLEACTGDPVLASCARGFPERVRALDAAIDAGHTDSFQRDQQRLVEVRGFLTSAASEAPDPLAFTLAIVDRHGQVQRGKLDRGRPKLPWIERRGDRLELTLAQVGELARQPVEVDQINAHEYRTASADALLTAAEGAHE
jgi:hypothetical protein